LVILKSACFLIHALLPRDLKARGLKSAGSEKREVVPRAVKSARYPALLGKARTFDKIVQNQSNLKTRDIQHFFRPKVRDIPRFLVKI
jgi:hypothetical protein